MPFDNAPDFHSLLPALKSLAADFDKGILPSDPKVIAILRDREGPDLGARWSQLSHLCLRLNAIANKQLRGVDFNDDEDQCFGDFGMNLAAVMGYDKNASNFPKDNAPRIADVYRNPWHNLFLEVGVGRPRALFVLYPYHGGEVLCEGAVMPYYEFGHVAPMTNGDWMDMLKSKTPRKQFLPIP